MNEVINKLKQEWKDLLDKLFALERFMDSGTADELPEIEQRLLEIQQNAMLTYEEILLARIMLLEKRQEEANG